MKKNAFLMVVLILSGISTRSYSQENKTNDTWLKTGSALNYSVQAGTKNYEFNISDLLITNDIAFSWKMTAPVNTSGKVSMNIDAIDTSKTMVNYFSDKSVQNLTDKTTVWLSRKVYKLLLGQQAVNMTIDNQKETIKYLRNEKYTLTIDGAKTEVDVMVAGSDAGSTFWILNDPKNPLIVKMNLAFTIELKSVKTAK
jgi:hypothetical protein